MNKKIVLLPVAVSLAAYLYGCGQTNQNPTPPVASTYVPTVQPRASYEIKCEDQQAQQRDVEFHQQKDLPEFQNCTPELQFVDSKLTDLKVDLDCNENQVVVQNKKGPDQQKAIFPIQSDGNFQGQLNIQQQVQQDPKGNMHCYVEEQTKFEGQAKCDSDQSLSLTTQVRFEQPSPTPAQPCQFAEPKEVHEDKLTIRIPSGAKDKGCEAFGAQPFEVNPGTWVSWINKDSEAHSIISDTEEWDTQNITSGDVFTVNLPRPGIYTYHSKQHPSMRGMIIVSPMTGPSPSPGSSPSPGPSPSPSPSPSIHPESSESPTPSASPSAVPPKVICVVEKPCPVVAKIEHKCTPSRR